MYVLAFSSMIMVSANETFKKILNPSGEMNVSAYIASGAAAGALVWISIRVIECCKCVARTLTLGYVVAMLLLAVRARLEG